MDNISKANSYLKMADDTRKRADAVDDAELRRHILELSEAYEQVAAHCMSVAKQAGEIRP